MNRSFILLFVLIALYSCKPEPRDLAGSEDMSGKIYLHNPYDSAPPVLLANQPVLLQRSSNLTASAFIYGTNSDANGRFNFSYLTIDTLYRIHAEKIANTRIDQDILFTADTLLLPTIDLKLTMTPDTMQQNGIFVLCTDQNTPSPGAMPNCRIYIYTSRILANADTSIIGNGASYSFQTNVEGKALKMRLPHNEDLFIRATVNYTPDTSYTSSISTIRLPINGIRQVNLMLE